MSCTQSIKRVNHENNLMPYEQKQEFINTLRLERMRLNFTASLYDNGIARTQHTPTRHPEGVRKSTPSLSNYLRHPDTSSLNCFQPQAR